MVSHHKFRSHVTEPGCQPGGRAPEARFDFSRQDTPWPRRHLVSNNHPRRVSTIFSSTLCKSQPSWLFINQMERHSPATCQARHAVWRRSEPSRAAPLAPGQLLEKYKIGPGRLGDNHVPHACGSINIVRSSGPGILTPRNTHLPLLRRNLRRPFDSPTFCCSWT